MGTVKINAKVKEQVLLATDIYSMVLYAPEISEQASAGQFVSVFSADGARLLPRPISLCEIDKTEGTLRLVYRIAGEGTREFSGLKTGDRVEVMGPLGNGFTPKEGPAILIGGGIGIPPMLQLARELGVEKKIVLGFRDEIFLTEEFEAAGQVFLASEDGKHGVKGNVMDAIREYGIKGDVIYACGPTPMLRAVQAYAKEHQIEVQISLEEKMACGIGACLACVCRSEEKDAHSHVNNKRICKDGPVFDAGEVVL